MFSKSYKKSKVNHNIYFIFFAIAYLIYTSLSDIYPLLPPLVGVLFLIFHKHYNDRNHYVSILVLLCVFYYEFDKSLIFGIMPLVFFVTHLLVANSLESAMELNWLFIVIYVALLYLLYVAGMILSNILFKTNVLDFSLIYVYYAVFDCALALLYYFLFMRV
ncbi:hypothetical protein DCO58_04205 [Helicobacter saguini]|uniref:Uncharacterized protein n=1 Tax=Helicobacter saguini TaxID=1548018 RepID=A0A347VUB0_9HELI|nr:hypothetical protein [Helicobacter saguini]MWV62441.1 hypothetical protein [Helicobacter saguini]MWV66887.1 hypothetical protein [Helicobacter saguini]MWV69235.1 hypothetical protein [Helicobacter saguini]MWV71209.1 hypothetical protein [Helicobacter saguini]TLD93315.1 hypothetical protein LS64_008740 [Helicobacter saguini]